MQFSVWYRNGDCEHKTMPRIAKALGMVPSQHVLDILNEMAQSGDLICEKRDQSGRFTTNFYLLVESRLITEKYHRRHISVKSRGVAVGQLEMFS
jgi:hypothetical protein